MESEVHYRIHKCSVLVRCFLCEWFVTQYVFTASCQHLAQPPKPGDHPLSAVHDCLVSIFEATLHIRGGSSIRNLRTRHGGRDST
jgi:hypothetical protein